MAQVKISALPFNPSPPTNAELIIANNGVSEKVSVGSITRAGGQYVWKTINTSTYTAIFYDGLFVDTSAGQIGINLPKILNVGDRIKFADVSDNWDINNVTLNSAGGDTFNSVISPLILNIKSAVIELVASSATNWRVI